MRKFVWTVMCCALCVTVTSCTKEEDKSDEAATAQETEDAEEIALVGTWEIIEWKADDVDQLDMWRIVDLTVDFRDDGSMETKLAYDNGEERSSAGTWKRSGDIVEVTVKGGGVDGDEPFERTREYTIDQLTDGEFLVHGEIRPTDKPIVLTYRALRMTGE